MAKFRRFLIVLNRELLWLCLHHIFSMALQFQLVKKWNFCYFIFIATVGYFLVHCIVPNFPSIPLFFVINFIGIVTCYKLCGFVHHCEYAWSWAQIIKLQCWDHSIIALHLRFVYAMSFVTGLFFSDIRTFSSLYKQ